MKKTVNKSTLRAIILGFICLVIFAVIFIDNAEIFKTDSAYNANNDDFVKIIDVGQGDSVLIYSNGYSALVDVGIPDAANEICAALEEHNIEFLDVLMLTHLDNDHVGGVSGVTQVFEVKNLILPEISIESEGLNAAQFAINRVKASGGEIFTAVEGMNFKIGEFTITILSHLTEMNNDNNRSIVAMAEIDKRKFLLTGDIEAKGERAIIEEGIDLGCDVLKVAHHGSNSSTTDEFLKLAKPSYAAISVGVDNRYGHPHSNVLSALEYYGAKIYRTDLDGDIIFFVNDGKISVKTNK